MVRLRVIVSLTLLLCSYSALSEDLEDVKRIGLFRARHKYSFNHPPLDEDDDPVPALSVYNKVLEKESRLQKYTKVEIAEEEEINSSRNSHIFNKKQEDLTTQNYDEGVTTKDITTVAYLNENVSENATTKVNSDEQTSKPKYKTRRYKTQQLIDTNRRRPTFAVNNVESSPVVKTKLLRYSPKLSRPQEKSYISAVEPEFQVKNSNFEFTENEEEITTSNPNITDKNQDDIKLTIHKAYETTPVESTFHDMENVLEQMTTTKQPNNDILNSKYKRRRYKGSQFTYTNIRRPSTAVSYDEDMENITPTIGTRTRTRKYKSRLQNTAAKQPILPDQSELGESDYTSKQLLLRKFSSGSNSDTESEITPTKTIRNQKHYRNSIERNSNSGTTRFSKLTPISNLDNFDINENSDDYISEKDILLNSEKSLNKEIQTEDQRVATSYRTKPRVRVLKRKYFKRPQFLNSQGLENSEEIFSSATDQSSSAKSDKVNNGASNAEFKPNLEKTSMRYYIKRPIFTNSRNDSNSVENLRTTSNKIEKLNIKDKTQKTEGNNTLSTNDTNTPIMKINTRHYLNRPQTTSILSNNQNRGMHEERNKMERNTPSENLDEKLISRKKYNILSRDITQDDAKSTRSYTETPASYRRYKSRQQVSSYYTKTTIGDQDLPTTNKDLIIQNDTRVSNKHRHSDEIVQVHSDQDAEITSRIAFSRKRIHADKTILLSNKNEEGVPKDIYFETTMHSSAPSSEIKHEATTVSKETEHVVNNFMDNADTSDKQIKIENETKNNHPVLIDMSRSVVENHVAKIINTLSEKKQKASKIASAQLPTDADIKSVKILRNRPMSRKYSHQSTKNIEEENIVKQPELNAYRKTSRTEIYNEETNKFKTENIPIRKNRRRPTASRDKIIKSQDETLTTKEESTVRHISTTVRTKPITESNLGSQSNENRQNEEKPWLTLKTHFQTKESDGVSEKQTFGYGREEFTKSHFNENYTDHSNLTTFDTSRQRQSFSRTFSNVVNENLLKSVETTKWGTNTPEIKSSENLSRGFTNKSIILKPQKDTQSSTNTSKQRIHGDPNRIVKIVEMENKLFTQNGKFVYGYKTADGTQAYSSGVLKEVNNEHAGEAVIGGFAYTDKDGNDFSVSYTADENGYRPVGAHLPTPPPIPPAIARALAYLATKTTPEPVTESIKKQ